MASVEQLPTPDELMASPAWGSLDADQRADVVDAWALETRNAHDWTPDQSRAIDGALDDFRNRAAQTKTEWVADFGKDIVKSGAASLAALPFAPLKLGYEEGKAAMIMASDATPEQKRDMLAREAPDALKLGAGYGRTIEGAKSLAREYNPLSANDEQWQGALDSLKNDVLERKLPDNPDELYTVLKKHGLRIAQATAKLHGGGTADYLPMEWQDVNEDGMRSVFKEALSGKRTGGFYDSPDDVHRAGGVTFKNQSRSLVASPENLGLLMQFSATRNPKYFDALVQRLGRSRTRQQQDVAGAEIDRARQEDALDAAVRSIFSLGGVAPGVGERMVSEVQGLAQSPVDMATTAFSFGMGRAALKAAGAGLMRTAGKVAMGTGAEFIQGAASGLGDESVPTMGNILKQGLLEAGAGGVVQAAGAATQGALNRFASVNKGPGASADSAAAGAGSSPAAGTSPAPAVSPVTGGPGVLAQIAQNAGASAPVTPVATEGATDAEFSAAEQDVLAQISAASAPAPASPSVASQGSPAPTSAPVPAGQSPAPPAATESFATSSAEAAIGTPVEQPRVPSEEPIGEKRPSAPSQSGQVQPATTPEAGEESSTASNDKQATLPEDVKPGGESPVAGAGFRVPPAQRNTEGGFVQLPKEFTGALDHGAALFRNGVTRFSQWSAEMVRRFGEAIRQYLQGVWAAARKTSRVGAINPGADPVPARPAAKVAYKDTGLSEQELAAALDSEWRSFWTSGRSFDKSNAEIAAEWAQELADPEGGTVQYAATTWKQEQRGSLSDAVQFDVDHSVPAEVDASAKVVEAGKATGFKVPKPDTRSGAAGGFIALPDLSAATRAVRTGTTAQPGERSTLAYQGTGPYRVQLGAKRAILTGSTLPKEFADAIARTRDEELSLNNAVARVAKDLDAEMKRQARLGIQTREQLEQRVNEAMDDPAQMALLQSTNLPLHEAALRARNMLDHLSAAIAAQTGGQVGDTIVHNLGTWMRRSYMAFDASTGWNLDNLRKAAAAGRSLNGQPARRILSNAEAYLRSQASTPLTSPQLEAMLRDLTDRTVWMGELTRSGSSAATKDVSSLMRRKDIPEPIRALMGEVRDPLARFSQSASWQAQYIARHQMQERMRELGLRMGIFSNTREGVYHVKVGGEDGPARQWSGFGDNLYTTPEMLEALRNAQGVMTGTDLGGWLLNTVKFMAGEAKMNKVALNPDSWMVNLFGNVVGLAATGDLASLSGWRNVLRSWHQTRQAGRRVDFNASAADRASIEAARRLQAQLEAAGVINAGFLMQDLTSSLNNTVREALESTKTRDAVTGIVRGALVGSSLGRGGGSVGRAIGATVGAVAGGAVGAKQIVEVQKKFAEWLMSKPDNFAKTVAFLNNYEAYSRAGMPAEEARNRAIEIVRNTMPNYSKLPSLAREASRIGLMGSFIAFQFEVYRNVFHNLRYAAQEIRSGNPALMRRGAARLLGVSSVLTLGGWAAMSALLFGKSADDEKDEAYRRALARPWDANSPLVYSKLDDKQASFWNMGYLIPQSTIFDLMRGAMSGRTFEESLGNAYDVAVKQFADGGVHTNPLLEAVFNARRGGGQVSYSEDGIRNAMERVDHVLRNVFTPGYADKAERLERAVTGRQRGDRVYTIEEEMKRLLGVRASTYTHDETIAGRLFAFRERADAARQTAKMAFTEWGKDRPDTIGAEEQQRALTRANEARAAIAADYKAWLGDLSKLGITEARVKRIAKDRRASFNTDPLKLTPKGVETATK